MIFLKSQHQNGTLLIAQLIDRVQFTAAPYLSQIKIGLRR
jgi:hypothetical protein